MHVAGLLLKQLVEHIRVVLAFLAVQVDAEPLHGVEDQGHRVDGVGVHDWLEHDPLLEAIVRLVNNSHLLQKCGLPRLGRAKQKEVNFIWDNK